MTKQGAAAAAMQRFRDRYGLALEWVVGALMVVLALEVTAGVVFRAAGHSLIWYDEIASHLLAWLTFYGSALASVKRAHIGCPEVVERMPWRARRAFNVAAQLIVISFFALLGAIGVMVLPVLSTDALVSIPSIPMSIVQSVTPISAALIIVGEATYLVELVLQRRPAKGESGLSLAEGLH